MYPKPIQKLIDAFSKLPGVGPKTAARFTFYLRKSSEKEIKNLIQSIKDLKKNIKTCSFCFSSLETSEEKNLCPICQDPSRDRTLLCVVEREQDQVSIESTKKYKGIYFILGGTIPTLKKEKKQIRDKELKQRIKNPEKFGLFGASFKETILALNPTPEGKATMLYLKRFLKPLKIKITSLGLGLPKGGELEYADRETLTEALKGRK